MTINIYADSKAENKYRLPEKNKNKNQVSFQGMESAANFICTQVQTNKIVEYTAVDFISMVAPRTAVDYTRSDDAGEETFRREMGSVVTECLSPGIFAAAIGFMLGKVINPKLNINTAFPVESDTLEMLKKAWNHTNPAQGGNQNQAVLNFVEHVFNKTEGLVGQDGVKGQGWIKLADKSKETKTLYDELVNLITGENKASGKELKDIKAKFVQILGASENIRTGGEKGLATTVERLVDGVHHVGRILTKLGSDKGNAAIEKMIKINPIKTFIVMAAISGFGFSQQFINRYLTKKKTGSDAFVGLSQEAKLSSNAEKQDKNSKFNLMIEKIVSIGAMMAIAAFSIANSIKPKTIIETFKPANLIKKLEFNGWFPHVNQLRVFYAAIIIGRILSASDKNELRETNTRDISGFLNWLILGGFVSKGVGNWISNGKLINSAKPLEKNAGILAKIGHFLGNKNLKSHAEIDAMKNLSDAAKKALKSKLNKSIFAGLAYSTLALGLFMPMLNKYITNKLTAKKQPENYNNSDEFSFSQVNNEIFADFIKMQQKFKKA